MNCLLSNIDSLKSTWARPKGIVFLLSLLFFSFAATAQTLNATLRVNQAQLYQQVTGFGGFVNSPQFAYNYMSEAEIRQLWGKNSSTGYNIMRIYIPTGTNNWAQVIPTVQLAKSLGLKIFASPWSMPTEWKSAPVIGSVYTDASGVKRNNYLKEEHYADYANYLNSFVVLLRNNGVELDAISIQNEPDYQVDYAGCIFTPAQITKFLKENRHLISCKVMAPETVGIPDNYANAFTASDVLPHFDVFAGHQYGGIQTAHKNLQGLGKEVWMTEYLINWNQHGVSRNFTWGTDAFDFAIKVNEAMLANINAWVHYASKRYYALMGDGTFGTPLSAISKRGYLLAHFARYVTGCTRTQSTWSDNSGVLQGSSYLSATGDSVVVMVINNSPNRYSLAVDLPFLTQQARLITTTETADMATSDTIFATNTNRPRVNIAPSSVSTLIFPKSGSITPSQMVGQLVQYAPIDAITPTSPAFGNQYQLSGKTVTFKVDAPLFSNYQHIANGYLPVNGAYNRLVFRVESISSPASYTSANTTLYYVNQAGMVRSYNYGTISFPVRNHFDWVLDISPNVLTDGCRGIIGLFNGNYTSVLSLKLNDVYLAAGKERGFRLSGPFSSTDGNLPDVLEDSTYTSIDLSGVTQLPAGTPLQALAANKNAVYYLPSAEAATGINTVAAGSSSQLLLSDKGGDFYPPQGFTAPFARFTLQLSGSRLLTLPFEAAIPQGLQVFSLSLSNGTVYGQLITQGRIPAHTPVLVHGFGTFVLEGSGQVVPALNPANGLSRSIYIGIPAPLGSYYLETTNGVPGFRRVTPGNQPYLAAFDACLIPDAATTTAGSLPLQLDAVLPVTYTALSARARGNTVEVSWQTLNEAGISGFEVERSRDGISFESVGNLKASGTGVGTKAYRWVDIYPNQGVNYYRLKVKDLQGEVGYSAICRVSLAGTEVPQIYPNPAVHTLYLQPGTQSGSGSFEVWNAAGKQVLRTPVWGSYPVQVNIAGWQPGIYFYRINGYSGKFLKQ